MNRIYVPTTSAEDWRKLLAKPEKHWKSGYSAKDLAECWEAANGFPASFQAMFALSKNPALQKLEVLLAIPEYRVGMPGGGHSPQNDLFVLARAEDGGLVSITVEGKMNETFGETLDAWLVDASAGKKKRLKFLYTSLGLPEQLPGSIRYQLLHRTVSALLEANRFNASNAMMIVHSFSPSAAGFKDYQAFLGLFGLLAQPGELVKLPMGGSVSLSLGWISEN